MYVGDTQEMVWQRIFNLYASSSKVKNRNLVLECQYVIKEIEYHGE